MHVLPKNRVSPMFDIDIIGNVVSFKERDRDDAIVEHRLETSTRSWTESNAN